MRTHFEVRPRLLRSAVIRASTKSALKELGVLGKRYKALKDASMALDRLPVNLRPDCEVCECGYAGQFA